MLPTQPVKAPAPARRPANRLRVTALAMATALLAPLAGCVVVTSSSGCQEQASYKSVKTVTIPAQNAPGLDAQTANGSITAAKDASATETTVTVTVRATSQERADAATVVTGQVDGGGVSIRIGWPDGQRRPSEGASIKIVTPDAQWLRLATSNGSVESTGLRGVGEISTTNGRITVRDHAGDLKARTTNGNIEATSVSGAVAATSTNGKILASGVSGFVDASTTNGNVNVSLADTSTGPVKISTTNGGVQLSVPRAFTGEIEARTTNGSVSSNLPESMVRGTDRNQKTIIFSTGGVRSEVRTSNGGITIDGRM